MTWTATEGSHVFRSFVADTLLQGSSTAYTGLDSDSTKCALYGNTGTPDRNVAANLTGYNTGQWVVGNEISGTGWAATGLILSTPVVNQGTANTFYFDAVDRATTATATLTNVYGCLNYDDTVSGGTVADVGISFHYFGGGSERNSRDIHRNLGCPNGCDLLGDRLTCGFSTSEAAIP